MADTGNETYDVPGPGSTIGPASVVGVRGARRMAKEAPVG